MNALEWIGFGTLLLAVIVQCCAGAYQFGFIRKGVENLVERGDRQDARLDTIDVRLNDHTERIGRIEGRLDPRGE
jgi:hypothetical protein